MWDDLTKRNTNEIGKEKEQVLDLQNCYCQIISSEFSSQYISKLSYEDLKTIW